MYITELLFHLKVLSKDDECVKITFPSEHAIQSHWVLMNRKLTRGLSFMKGNYMI